MSDLSPQPDPKIEDPEPPPGGPDAVEDRRGGEVPDPDPAKNPTTESVPDELREGEDTSTEATRDDDELEESPEGDAAGADDDSHDSPA